MGHLITMMLFLLCGTQTNQNLNDDVDEQGFRQAVLNAYDINKSFSENFFSILGIICPTSVYCTDNNTGTSEIGTHGFWDSSADDANFSTGFFSNYKPSVTAEARAILQRNVHKLRGCCIPCSCEEQCVERQNCCPTMRKMLQTYDGVEKESQVRQECVYASINSNPRSSKAQPMYFMVTDCFSANVSREITIKCRQPNPAFLDEARPVYSNSTKRIYKNKYCAECNEANQFTPWIAVISFNDFFSLTGRVTVQSTPEDMYAHAVRLQRYYNLYFISPANMPLDTNEYKCLISSLEPISGSCSAEHTDFDPDTKYLLKRVCEFQKYQYDTGRIFENVFCFLCDINIYSEERRCRGISKSISTSFSAILNLDQPKPHTDAKMSIESEEMPCECTEYFDETKKLCRTLVCPPGEVFAECVCNAFLKNITHMPLQIYLEVAPDPPENVIDEQHGIKPGINIVKAIVRKVKELLDSSFGPLEAKTSLLLRETSASNKSYAKLYYLIFITFKSSTDDKQAIKSMFKTILSGISTKILGKPMRVSLGRIFEVRPVSVAGRISDTFHSEDPDVMLEQLWPTESETSNVDLYSKLRHSQIFSKLVYCKRVKLEEDEVELLQNNSMAVGLSQPYLSYVFWKEDWSMCLDDFETFLADASSAMSFCNTNTMAVWLVVWVGCYEW